MKAQGNHTEGNKNMRVTLQIQSNYTNVRGAHFLGARSPWWPNFLLELMIVGNPQYGT